MPTLPASVGNVGERKKKMINENVLEYYFKEKVKVHIAHKNKDFFNGVIIQLNKDKKFIVVEDRVLGSVPIMFEEIFKIKPFEVEKE